MRFSLKPGRNKSRHDIYRQHENQFQHPDLPLSPDPNARRPLSPRSTDSDPFSADRRSLAVVSAGQDNSHSSTPYAPDDFPLPSPPLLPGGLSRSHTLLRKVSSRKTGQSSPASSTKPRKTTDLDLLLTPSEQAAVPSRREVHEVGVPMSSQYSVNSKTSSDSGQSSALDRWSQRRLQRLNTEQGFREQRQGGAQAVLSPPLSQESSYSNASGVPYQDTQPQHQHTQPHPLAYQSQQRTAPPSQTNAGLGVQTQSVSLSSRANNYPPHDASLPQTYSPPASASQYHQDAPRPALTQSRSFNSQQDDSKSTSNSTSAAAAKSSRSGMSNRQSVHNGLTSREGSALAAQGGGHPGVPAFNANVVPSGEHQAQGYGNAQQKAAGDNGRSTPQPTKPMTKEDIEQLIQDHAQLREKYTKVKKYYFEKEDQVKQLQNSLAHQRLSQSRTSLDDSEYTTRFSRLDGLVAQLAFSIRKSWRSIPTWLVNSVNKDAVATGKQEMTAAGRAFISCWLVEEVFDKYFHPDLDPALSSELKVIQHNIRRYAPIAQTAEEQEYLTSKVVNWRLATLEGLNDALRSPNCPTIRTQLTDTLKEQLVNALAVHLQDPPPSDLEGGVHMIIELVISIAIHLPLESREVSIEYFMPGYSILPEQMKVETGIPALTMSVADDAAERASSQTDVSEVTDTTDASTLVGDPSKKRSMLSALTGSNKPKESQQRKISGAGGSSSSLNRPDSSQGLKHDAPPRVRMSAGIGVQIRGRSVLVKAPVFATA